jgi:hypothetical protein
MDETNDPIASTEATVTGPAHASAGTGRHAGSSAGSTGKRQSRREGSRQAWGTFDAGTDVPRKGREGKLLYVADGFFEGRNNNDRRRSACANAAFRAGAAASGFMNTVRCLAVVAGLFILRDRLPMFGHVLVPCFMRFHALHLVHKHRAVARAAINGSLMVHAAFCCRYPGHASHGQGHDKQE